MIADPNRLKLTENAVQKIKLFDPKNERVVKKYKIYWDTKIEGFGVRANQKSKSYIFKQRLKNGRGKTVWITIGRCNHMSLDKARELAREKYQEIVSGQNPNKTVKKGSYTLLSVFEEFLVNRDLKPRTIQDYKKNLGLVGKSRDGKKRFFEDWKNIEVQDITGDMIVNRYQKLKEEKGKAQASGAMRFLRALLNFAQAKYEDSEGNPVIKVNPVLKLSAIVDKKWGQIKRRRTIISNNDLSKWYEVVMELKSTKGQDYLMLVFLTGMRRQEPMKLEWNRDVDMSRKSFIIHDPKNSEPLVLPMGRQVYKVFKRREADREDSPYVFPGRAGKPLNNPQKWVDAVNKTVKFCLHDLRRGFITTAERLNISHYAFKALVNHSLGDDVTAGYIVTDPERYRPEMQALENELMRLCKAKK